MKHLKDIVKFVQAGDLEATDSGLLIHSSILARGKYFHTVNGKDEQVDHNLIPTEGINHILNVALGATAKAAAWYLGLNGGSATPQATWTGVNYAANANEIVSQSEGYSGANRPVWTPAAAAAGKVGNLASRAQYLVVCTSTITVYGAGLLSTQTRGSTSASDNVLVSSSLFANPRILNNGDTFELGYEVELTDT